jgi:hypothetical protein
MGSATPPSLGTVSITSPLSSFLFSLVHGQINVFYIKRRSYTPLIHTLDDPIVLTMVSKPRLLGCDLDRGKEKKKEKLTESKTKTQTLTYPMMGKGTTATRGKDLSSPRRRAGPISYASSPPVQIRELRRCCFVLARTRTRTKGRRSQGHSTAPRAAVRMHQRRASWQRHPLPPNASSTATVCRAPLWQLAGGARRAEGEKESREAGLAPGGTLPSRRRRRSPGG